MCFESLGNVFNFMFEFGVGCFVEGLFICFEIVSILLIVVVGDIFNSRDMLLMPQPSFSNNTICVLILLLYAWLVYFLSWTLLHRVHLNRWFPFAWKPYFTHLFLQILHFIFTNYFDTPKLTLLILKPIKGQKKRVVYNCILLFF